MRKRTKILIIIFIVIVTLSLLGIYMIKRINHEMEDLTNTSIHEIDLSNIDDRIYLGTFESLLIIVEVEVKIQNHLIIDIDILKHQNGQGDAAEIIIDDVLLLQKVNIDLISGATYSSKAILLALEDALSH